MKLKKIFVSLTNLIDTEWSIQDLDIHEVPWTFFGTEEQATPVFGREIPANFYDQTDEWDLRDIAAAMQAYPEKIVGSVVLPTKWRVETHYDRPACELLDTSFYEYKRFSLILQWTHLQDVFIQVSQTSVTEKEVIDAIDGRLISSYVGLFI